MIVDPYFARPELRFAFAISRVIVPVSVLTSHDGLIEREKKGELPEAFVASVSRFLATPNANPLEVRVMAGAGIHDRFLVIDDRVFLLGSSLNRFGDRGTMIVELRDPEVVRGALLRELATSKLLAQWLTDRRAAQQAQPSEDIMPAVESTSSADTTPAVESTSNADKPPAVESISNADKPPAVESISNADTTPAVESTSNEGGA